MKETDRELRSKLKSALSFFTTLSNTVKQANKDNPCRQIEINYRNSRHRGDETETETTRFYVDYDDLMLSLLKEAAQK
ncbi:hemolysin E [Shigella sonnei]